MPRTDDLTNARVVQADEFYEEFARKPTTSVVG